MKFLVSLISFSLLSLNAFASQLNLACFPTQPGSGPAIGIVYDSEVGVKDLRSIVSSPMGDRMIETVYENRIVLANAKGASQLTVKGTFQFTILTVDVNLKTLVAKATFANAMEPSEVVDLGCIPYAPEF